MVKKSKKLGETETTRYDVAEHLRTPEEMAAYLEAWFVETQDDADGVARALSDVARAKAMIKAAKDVGV